MKHGGCWIFLSHSSKDIEKVRLIRNAFEKNGQNPLAFHLRCLNTDTIEGRQELDSLIKREIDCREWFVFCESPDASKSEYVQMEKDYIIKTGKKKIWYIDVTMSVEAIVDKVNEICTDISVFLSYSHGNLDFAKDLENALVERDYSVWTDLQLQPGVSWLDQMERNIQLAAKNGFIILLITNEYLKSDCALMEMERILSLKAEIIPIIIGDVIVPSCLKNIQCLYIPHIPSTKDAVLIVELIEEKLKSKIVGPIRIQANLLNKLTEIQERLNYGHRYHSKEAILIQQLGAADDYCEVYKFPCCGKIIAVGDGQPSRYRSDGCCED